MQLHKQLFPHDPAGDQYGDCFRTALACLLDLEPSSVPHFMHDGTGEDSVWARVNEWLAPRNLAHCTFAVCGDLSDVFRMMSSVNAGAYYLLAGSSSRGFNHQVIALNDAILHDPSPSDAGLCGPCDDGYYWISFLVPLNIHGAPKV